MQNQKLPEPLMGQWIWLRETELRQETHLFFRRDFCVSEMPGSCELWITARSSFHLYINGQLCALGPSEHPLQKSYTYCIDINYLVQVGSNQIAVQVYNAGVPLVNHGQKTGGFWAQLQVDGKPLVWSDEDWRCLTPECYPVPGIIRGLGATSMEILDFRNFPHGWQRIDPSAATRTDGGARKVLRLQWYRPQVLADAEKSRELLEPAPNADDIVETCNWTRTAFVGGYRQVRQALWMNFRSLTKRLGTGVFAAETFLHSDTDTRQGLYCFCDSPYRFYLNDELVSEQAVESAPVHAAPNFRGDRRLGMDEYTSVFQEINLKKGWNRLLWLQDCASHGAGMTMVWQDAPNGSIMVRQLPDEKAKEGWNLAGPLRTPLGLTHPIIKVDNKNKFDYILIDKPAWDMSVALTAYNFAPRKALSEILNEPTQILQDKHFVVFDFGRTLFGFPHISLQGSEGDMVLVVCGEHCVDGEVLSYVGGKRKASTLLLSGKRDTWISLTPRGFRYIMVLGHDVRGKVVVESVQAKVPNRALNNRGSFNSSDAVYNEIWDAGSLTLNSCVRGCFMDAPGRDQAQYISDAMIQSWAAFHLFGDFQLSATCLSDFAKTQLETGELNAVSPSGFFQAVPDFSLLWIVWLHRHIQYTGDEAFLRKMFPHMERLLNYYDRIAMSPDNVLGDLRELMGTYCFLDHDEIDRQGISTGLNGIYCRALNCAAVLSENYGRSDLASLYRGRAAKVASQIRSLAWNEEKGLFADSFYNSEKSSSYSWQSNILALYGGVASPENYSTIWDKLYQDRPPYEKQVHADYNNPYFKYFLLEVACAIGKSAWALRFIRYYWGKMLDAGAITWWELFNPEGDDQNLRQMSKCQGYAVSPNAFLISELVGIRPAEPGMSRVVFNPCPKACAWVKAKIPTPKGSIRVEWRKNVEQVFVANISATYPLEIIPILDPEVAEKAEFQVSDNITILTPDDDDLIIEEENGHGGAGAP
ncbi:MAG: family 78 glycoside hydrolase catalytic domain [Oligosphaeraceae bacterium]|nr:family 78 glycoside hydrolase catalytic domain [Oligosphaeraceae bacterium]